MKTLILILILILILLTGCTQELDLCGNHQEDCTITPTHPPLSPRCQLPDGNGNVISCADPVYGNWVWVTNTPYAVGRCNETPCTLGAQCLIHIPSAGNPETVGVCEP
jgi:hypothetical protein